MDSGIASDIVHQLAQIIPDLRLTQLTPRPSVNDNVDPAEARFRLFDAVTNFLKIGTRPHPMLIVLDDLHDADEASLAMLRFMARETASEPLQPLRDVRPTARDNFPVIVSSTDDLVLWCSLLRTNL